MDIWTEGKTFHPGYRLALSYNTEELLPGEVTEFQNGYHIIVIQEGTGILRVGTATYPISSPGVYSFHEREHVRIVAGTPLHLKCLHFLPSIINDRIENLLRSSQQEDIEMNSSDVQDLWMFDFFTERKSDYFGCIPLDPSVAKHMEEILEEMGSSLHVQPDYYWPCRSRSYLMELLFLIRRSYQKASFTANTIPHNVPESVKPVIEYLHIHYKEKIKLEDLTATFHLNKTTLGERFKKSTGLSLIAYLNKIRMTMADSMLRNTILPTTEIMSRVGFQDDAHFIRHFRKYSGYSPAEFRNKYCWMLVGKS